MRQAQGWITFDDMLLTGWELLQRFPQMREMWQTRYDCVLVDDLGSIWYSQNCSTRWPHSAITWLSAMMTRPFTSGAALHPRFILDFPNQGSDF